MAARHTQDLHTVIILRRPISMEIPREPSRQPRSWYRKTGHVVLVIGGSIIGTMILIFLFFFGYYLWVNSYGDSGTQHELAKKFEQNFSAAPGLSSVGTGDTITTPVGSLIHDHTPITGNPGSPVTVVAFIDFECPYCQSAFPTFERIRDTYGPAVKIVFKHFPIESIHPHAKRAARGAACAQQQNGFWPYYSSLFIKKDFSTDEDLIQMARAQGLSIPLFQSCLTEAKTTAAIDKDIQDGIAIGVRGTPTYIVNQQKFEGVISDTEWDRILLQALQF